MRGHPYQACSPSTNRHAGFVQIYDVTGGLKRIKGADDGPLMALIRYANHSARGFAPLAKLAWRPRKRPSRGFEPSITRRDAA